MNAFNQLKNLYSENEDSIELIELNKIQDYPNHPYLIVESRVDNLVKSIEESGLISPIILQKIEDDNYYILSGHHRKRAYEKLGKEKIEAIIKINISEEEAKRIMIDSNLFQRSFTDLKLTEKAKVLSMRFEEIKVMKSLDEDFREKSNGLKSRDILANEYNMSESSVRRYIQINNLIDQFKFLADSSEILPSEAFNLSKLSKSMQKMVYKLKTQTEAKLNLSKLSKLSENLSFEEIKDILIKKPKEKTESDIKKEIENFIKKLMKNYPEKDIMKEISEIIENNSNI
ncbi:ParB/RepB/Spo0J family partition protein [Peptoniphilaceae bacterium SGI.131]